MLVVAGFAAFARASDDDARFLAGLRARRLYSLAETYCRQLFADEKLTPVERADLTIELLRVQAEQAANAPAADREALWDAARETAATFFREHRGNPRIELVQLQDALTALARGELARYEAEVAPNPDDAQQRARDALREAAAQLEQLDRSLADEIPRRNRLRLAPGQLSSDELISLQNNVQYQRARALRNQALSYPAESSDRIASLTACLQQLDEPLKRLGADDPLGWQIRLEQVQAQRLLGNVREAATLLNNMLAGRPPDEIQQRAIAETARVYLAANQPDRALDALAKADRAESAAVAELDLALLEAHLAKWQAAQASDDKPAAEQWQKKSVALVEVIEQAHGPYWGRRAETLLIRVAGRGGSSSNLDILRRTADSLYLKGQMDEALAAYDRAAEVARASRDDQQAFDLAYKAALLQQQRRLLADSAARLSALSLSMQTHDDAPKAHLLSAWMVAQQVRGGQADLSEYVAALQQQIATWPTNPAADQARVWLGALLEQQGKWGEATDAYRGVATTSDHFPEALTATARTARQWLDARVRDGESIEDDLASLLEYYKSFASGEAAGLDADLRRTAAIAAAEIALEYSRDGHAQAEQVIRAAFGDDLQGNDEQSSAARALMMLALAGQPGRQAAAEQIVDALKDASPLQLLNVVEGLDRVGNSANERLKAELARMQLQAIALLEPRRNQLNAEQQRGLERMHAESLANAGRRDEAVERFEQLANANPDDGDLRQRLAELLLRSSDAGEWKKALDQWRIVAARSQPDSPRWWNAKYHVALAQFKTGDKVGAAKLIRYLQATKGLGDSISTERFQRLLQQVE